MNFAETSKTSNTESIHVSEHIHVIICQVLHRRLIILKITDVHLYYLTTTTQRRVIIIQLGTKTEGSEYERCRFKVLDVSTITMVESPIGPLTCYINSVNRSFILPWNENTDWCLYYIRFSRLLRSCFWNTQSPLHTVNNKATGQSDGFYRHNHWISQYKTYFLYTLSQHCSTTCKIPYSQTILEPISVLIRKRIHRWPEYIKA